MGRIISDSLNITYIRAVISNIYGPGERSSRLINTSIRKLLRGEHCAFSSGEQMYDFIYIDDAVNILIAIGEKGKKNKTYYVGSLEPRPLKEFLLEMGEQVNPQLEIGLGEIPFQGISLSYHEFDVEAVKKDMGIVAEVEFKEGIRRTIDGMRE